MLPQKLAFVDVETTGLRPTFDRIIEIGILRVENQKLVKKYKTFINPGGYIPEEIVSLTGITAQDLENAPSFYQVKNEIKEMLHDAVLVAHNARFDLSFLKNEFKREEMSFSPKHFCTVKLARKLFPQLGRYNLDSIIENFQIECKKRHRAFDDAKVLWEFYKILQKSIAPETLLDALNLALKKPSVPIMLDQKTLDDLPNSSGVYIFYGTNSVPLYVGKSINIRDRVLSHFSSDYLSSKEMKISQQIERVETKITGGELGALLLESSLVKHLQPLYNRQLRLSRNLILLKKGITEDGYFTLKIEESPTVLIEDMEDILGVFKSKNQAKEALVDLTEKFSLCEKLLDLEKGEGECFGYRLEKCKGACKKKEGAAHYNLRFIQAFYKTKIRSWPFNGPIGIREKNLLEDKEELFFIDKWCYLGNAKPEDFDVSAKYDYDFDIDTYKILERYLKSSSNYKNIFTLKQDFKSY